MPHLALHRSTRQLFAAVALIATASVLMSGCNLAAAGAVLFSGPKTVEVQAVYTGLANQRIAVLVAADDTTLFHFPQAPKRLTESVLVAIASALPQATLLRPDAAMLYVERNPYWATRRPSAIMSELKVDRLVTLDLNQYSTHEPGNRHVFRGTIDASVSVCEADGVTPDNRVFDQVVHTEFPDRSSEFGLINGEEDQIQEAVIKIFSDQVAKLFHDHTLTLPAH
ncbi:MAG: hypothetical protein V3V20_08345 [Algisphaera sp.]